MKPYRHLPDNVRRHIVKVARENFWARIDNMPADMNAFWNPEATKYIDSALTDAAIIAATEVWNMKERGS